MYLAKVIKVENVYGPEK